MLIQQSPNWPWPPVCFLCRPCTSALPANRLAIRNLRRLERHFHAVALLQPADDDFDVLLAAARQQKLLRLRIAIEAQRLVLFENLVHRVAHAVFVLPRLGFDRERDGRLRQFHRRIVDRRSSCRQGIAGQRLLQLGHRADVARMQFGDRLNGLAQQDSRCAPAARSCCAARLSGSHRSSGRRNRL